MEGLLVVNCSLRSGKRLTTGPREFFCQACFSVLSLLGLACVCEPPACGLPLSSSISIREIGLRRILAGLHFQPTRQGVAQGHFIGVFEIAAGGQTARQAGDAYAQGLDEPGNIHCGGFTFKVRIGRQ